MKFDIYIDYEYQETIEAESQDMANIEAGLIANDRGIDTFRVIAEQTMKGKQ